MVERCLLTILLRESRRSGYTWNKSTLRHYEKDGVEFSILWGFNSCYGDICRQWVVDGNNVAGMKHRHRDGGVLFDCSCQRLGARPFEKDSMAYETLAKPLGVPWREETPHLNHYDFAEFEVPEAGEKIMAACRKELWNE